MAYYEIDKYLNKRVLIGFSEDIVEYLVDEISPSKKYLRLTYWKTFDDGSILSYINWMNFEDFKDSLVEVL